MSLLHMETDLVRQLAVELGQKTRELQGEIERLAGNLQIIEWIGPSRDDFVAEADGVLRALQAQANSGVVLAERVEDEVNEWEQVASALGGSGDFSAQFRASLPAILGIGFGGGAAVLGVSTLTAMPISGGALMSVADYSAMKWTDKFAAQKSLQAQIAATATAIASGQTLLIALDGQLQALKNSNCDGWLALLAWRACPFFYQSLLQNPS